MEFSQLLQGSDLDTFLLKTLRLDWVAFHSVIFQLKCLDFQCNHCKKLVPVLSRFCNGLLATCCRTSTSVSFLIATAGIPRSPRDETWSSIKDFKGEITIRTLVLRGLPYSTSTTIGKHAKPATSHSQWAGFQKPYCFQRTNGRLYLVRERSFRHQIAFSRQKKPFSKGPRQN